MSSNLYNANQQWASRPADERFWTLAEAHAASKGYADIATEQSIDFGTEAIMVGDNDNLCITLDGGKGKQTANFTHWSFGQLARTAGAPAEYLRRLPPALAAQCLDVGLDKHFGSAKSMSKQALVHANGSTVLRSLTSEIYSRFWNHQVFERLVAMEQQGWRVPPARPVDADKTPYSRLATKADVLANKSSGGGLSIKIGDAIAPAGIYASDHDMFAFMVNENYRIDDGSDGGLSRGFFVQNSEVGASSLRVTLFQYRHVCGNHIVWGAENVVEVAVRHVGDVEGKFSVEVLSTINDHLKASARLDEQRIKKARKTILGATKEDVLDAVFKAMSSNRRAGLNSGNSFKQIEMAYTVAEEHADTDGDPKSVWGYVNGMTRLSQSTPYMDERAFLDRSASLVLATVAI